jgi:hypothetical protein
MVNVTWSIIYIMVNASIEVSITIQAHMTQFLVITTYSTRCVFLFVGVCYHLFEQKFSFITQRQCKIEDINHRFMKIERFIISTQKGVFVVAVMIYSIFDESTLFPEMSMLDPDYVDLLQTVITQSVVPSCLIWLYLICYMFHYISKVNRKTDVIHNEMEPKTLCFLTFLAFPFCVIIVGLFALFELKIIPREMDMWFERCL